MLRTAAGDRRAWTRLVERHLSAVVGYAWHLLDSHAEAEDVAQETFVRLLSKVGQWQPGGASLRAWLYRVATNLCIDQRRLRRTIGLADAPEPPRAAETEAELDQYLDRRRLVRRALQELPEGQRMAIILIYYHGFTNREAAELMGVSVDAVESRLARARRALRRRLQPVKPDLLGAL